MALPRNYRPGTPDKDCFGCRFLHRPTVYCDRWGEHADRGFVCNAWRPRETIVVTVRKERVA